MRKYIKGMIIRLITLIGIIVLTALGLLIAVAWIPTYILTGIELFELTFDWLGDKMKLIENLKTK